MSPTSTLRPSTARRHPVLAVLAACALAAGVAHFFLNGDAASRMASLSWTFAGLFAVLSCAVAVRETCDPVQRRRWGLLSVASGAWLLGELAWNVYEVTGRTPGTPSAADVGWLLFAPLAIAGVYLLSPDPPRVRPLVLLDVLAMLTVAGAFGIIVFYDDMVASALSDAGRVTAIAYSGLYVGLLLTFLQSLFRRLSLRRHPELVLLLVGQLCCALAFISWTPSLLDQSYVAGGNIIDALWTLGIVALGAAALEASGRPPLPPRTERDLGRTVLLPGAGVVALLAVQPVLAVQEQPLGQRLTVQVALIVAAAALLTRFFLLSRWHLALVDEVRDLYDSAPCGYHSIDSDGLVLRMNDTELSWLGYTREEVVGKVRIPDLLTPESAERWHAMMAPVRAEGTVHDVEYEVVRKDGTRMPVSLSATVVRDEAGRFVMSRSTIFDITERRRTSEHLSSVATELRRSNTELEQFAYAASHDLAEPLRTITSFGQMLSRRYSDKLDEKGERFLGHITDGAARMQRLIDSMLEYSRIGRDAPDPVTVDTRAIVDDVVSSLGATVLEQRATIDVGDLPVVSGIPDQLAQLFQNLIANALKFTGDRLPEVTVRAERDPEAAAWRFTVADNGIGIAERHVDRVFQMFQRLHARDEYEGTGIGLALCARIAEQHGGRIWVESELGAGSRFTFTIADRQESP